MSVTRAEIVPQAARVHRSMPKRSILLVLIACCALSAHADGTPSQGRVPFKDGLPHFPPLKKAVQNEPRTASLPVASDGAFHFVTGLNAEGARVWWLLHKKPDGMSTLLQLPMQEDAAGTLTATTKFERDATSNATTLLELSVPDTGDVLLYRWLAGDAATIALGQPLADFAVMTPDDRNLSLAELKGKGSIVVLNSWATYCVPCVEELPALNRLVSHPA
jgi:thiol-disulfide isomerase/thioredoxin